MHSCRNVQKTAKKRATQQGGMPRAYARCEIGTPATVNVPTDLLRWVEDQAHSQGISSSRAIVDVLIAWAKRKGFRPARA